jgi:hypothetical protein
MLEAVVVSTPEEVQRAILAGFMESSRDDVRASLSL